MQSSAKDRKFLIFEVHGSLYAFDLTLVSEVVDPLPCWPIPLAPDCFSGAVQIHGSIVAVIDLAAFFGLSQNREPSKMIVLVKDVAALAFQVARVIRIATLQQAEVQNSSGDDFTLSRLVLAEGEGRLLDVHKMVLAAEDMMK
ncbi:MAG: hypothetical protein A2X85_06190 [Geobacteraceae bacterium GWF2_54_21]|nr:MAG: hypothetical protein A2X85_06190 [Geobacteraceae bacterium GWF2_54_21]